MPPSSPIRQTRDKLLTPTLSQTSTDTYVDGETQRSDSRNGFDMKSFEAKNRAIQDQISRLMDGKKSPSSPAAVSSPTMATSSSFPSSGSSTTVQLLQLQMERLKSQVESLEKENSLLQSAVASQPTVEQTDNTALQNELSDALKQVQVVKEERDTALSQLSTARNETASAQRIVEDKQAKIDSLSQSNTSLTTQVNGLQDSAREAETKTKDLTAIVDEKESLIKTLKEAVEAKAGKEDEAAAAIKAKDVEIGLLESRIKRAAADFDDERKDLLTQVDELRTAGQVRVDDMYLDFCGLLIACLRKLLPFTKSALHSTKIAFMSWRARSRTSRPSSSNMLNVHLPQQPWPVTPMLPPKLRTRLSRSRSTTCSISCRPSRTRWRICA